MHSTISATASNDQVTETILPSQRHYIYNKQVSSVCICDLLTAVSIQLSFCHLQSPLCRSDVVFTNTCTKSSHCRLRQALHW